MLRRKRAASSGLARKQSGSKVARHGDNDPVFAPSQSSNAHRSLSSSVPSHHNLPSSLSSSAQLHHGASSLEDPNGVGDDGGIPETPLLEFYGSMENKIVGVRYYNGIVTPGESILCFRDLGNEYDSNAVQVNNVMGSQIGHLPRNLVQKLAPYMDRGEIVLDGILIGHKGPFDCPIRLYFYGTSDPAARLALEAKLKADKLLKAAELKNTRKEAQAQRALAHGRQNDAPALGMDTSEHSQSRQVVLEDSEAVDFRADPSALDVLNMDEATLSAMPQAAQPGEIKSSLLFHQLQVRHTYPWLNYF